MHTLRTLLSLAAVLVAVTFAGAQQVNFEAPELEGWEMPEYIKVVPEGRGHVLSVPQPGHAIWQCRAARDFTLKFRYRQGDGAGNVMFRVSGEPPQNQEYHLVLTVEQLEFAAVSGGEARQLGQAPVSLAPRTWHDVVLQAHSGSLQVSVDGTPVLRAADRTPLPAGIFGFGCSDGGGVAYDDISLSAGSGVGNVPAGGGVAATPINLPGPQVAGAGGVAATPINLPGGAQVALTPISLPGSSGSRKSLSIMEDPGTGSGTVSTPYRMMLKLPDIPGESTLRSDAKWIDVAAYSYGAKPVEAAPDKRGSGASLSPLKIIKYVDAASPALVLAALKKTSFNQATLVIGYLMNNQFITVLTIDLWDASVSEIESGGPNAYGYLTETVELSYERIRWSYVLRDQASGKPTSQLDASWDVGDNKAW